MTVRPGYTQEVIFAATATGGATGVGIPLLNQMAVVVGAFITYVASGTAGSRIVEVRLLDPAGNIMMSTIATTAITVSQTATLVLMSGQTYLNISSPIRQVLPWPAEMPALPGSSIRVLDTANISATDTVAANISFAT
jgi:hypothetical protein